MTAPRRRRWPLFLGLTLAALGAAVLLLPSLLGTAWMRPVLLRWLNTSPDREIEFAEVEMSWRDGIAVRGLTVREAGAPASEPLLVAETVGLDVEWLPLLRREILVEELTVREAVLDLRRPAAAAGPAAESGTEPGGGGGVEVTRARVPVTLDDVTIRFPRGDVHVEHGEVTLAVQGGELVVDPIDLDVNGGTLRGTARVGLEGADPAHELHLVAEGVTLDEYLAPLVARAVPLLAGEAGEDGTSGELGLTLDLTGRGATREAVTRSLTGGGTLALADVQVRSRDWVAELLRIVGRGQDGGLDLGRLDVPFVVADNRVTTTDVPIHAEVLDLLLGGHVTLDGELDYLVRLKSGLAGGAVEKYARFLDRDGYVPLRLTGPVTSPSLALPDAGTLLEGAVERGREALEGRAKDALDGLLGGK